jgi:CRP/FNR family transcriptional regulator
MSPDSQHYIPCLEVIKDSNIFKNLEIKEQHAILMHMTRVKWDKGVFKNSTECSSSMHFIISGRLKVYQINQKTGREHTIFIVSKGDVFDIMSLMDTEVHNVYWETLDALELLVIPNVEMVQLIEDCLKLQRSILRYLGTRMRMLEKASDDICLHNTLTRLSNLLLKHINGESHKLEIINNLPNDEIANLIGTTRAVVNRHMQELKKAGAITVKRKQIDIENLQTLIAMAENTYLAP